MKFFLPEVLKKFTCLALVCVLCGQAVAAPPEIPPPDIDAPAWVLMDPERGQVLAEKNADKPQAPASLAKLMTAYVLFEKLKAGKLRLDDQVAIGPQAGKAKRARVFLHSGTPARGENRRDLGRGNEPGGNGVGPAPDCVPERHRP